jgi:hypothetical protein
MTLKHISNRARTQKLHRNRIPKAEVLTKTIRPFAIKYLELYPALSPREMMVAISA